MKIQNVNNANQKVNFTSWRFLPGHSNQDYVSLREVLEDTFGLSLASNLKKYEQISGKINNDQILIDNVAKEALIKQIAKAMNKPKVYNSIQSYPALNNLVNECIKNAE